MNGLDSRVPRTAWLPVERQAIASRIVVFPAPFDHDPVRPVLKLMSVARAGGSL